MGKLVTIAIALVLVAPLIYAMAPAWELPRSGSLLGVSTAIWLILGQMVLLVLLCAAALAFNKPDAGDET
jgi:hypothetical protein